MQGVIDLALPVTIPFNKSLDGRYFVFQDYRQVGMADYVMLSNCHFVNLPKLGPACIGTIALQGGMGTDAESCEKGKSLNAKITFDSKRQEFVTNLSAKRNRVAGATCTVFTSKGTHAAYTHNITIEEQVRYERDLYKTTTN